MKIRIQFTDQDIANGKHGSVQESPLALAFRRWVERDGDVLTRLNVTHRLFVWQIQGDSAVHRAAVPMDYRQDFLEAMYGGCEWTTYEWDSGVCFTCQHRINSIAACASHSGDGLVVDPAPKSECKNHEGYGRKDESKITCTDWKGAEDV